MRRSSVWIALVLALPLALASTPVTPVTPVDRLEPTGASSPPANGTVGPSSIAQALRRRSNETSKPSTAATTSACGSTVEAGLTSTS